MQDRYSYSTIYTGGNSLLFFIILNTHEYLVDLSSVITKACRLRILVSSNLTKRFQNGSDVFGIEIFSQQFETISLSSDTEITLKNDTLAFSEKFTLATTEAGNALLQCCAFEDSPAHPGGVLEVILTPQPIVTIVFQLSSDHSVIQKLPVQKYFDSFSYLGFLLTDIQGMNALIEKKYGPNKELDLVYELANSSLVDELFDAGILIITWGINPFSYPIYSCQAIEDIEPVLGEPFGFSGKYTIRQDLHRFSIIPGHKLKNWSTSNAEVFPTMDILGDGNVVTLQSYSLKDKAGQSIIPSFALYRTWEASPATEPLLNINLLA